MDGRDSAQVFRTLARLFSEYGKAFFFTSAVEVRNADKDLLLGDLDLVWVMDGKLGIAEVKTSTTRFDAHDYVPPAQFLRAVDHESLALGFLSGISSDLNPAIPANRTEISTTPLGRFLFCAGNGSDLRQQLLSSGAVFSDGF